MCTGIAGALTPPSATDRDVCNADSPASMRRRQPLPNPFDRAPCQVWRACWCNAGNLTQKCGRRAGATAPQTGERVSCRHVLGCGRSSEPADLAHTLSSCAGASAARSERGGFQTACRSNIVDAKMAAAVPDRGALGGAAAGCSVGAADPHRPGSRRAHQVRHAAARPSGSSSSRTSCSSLLESTVAPRRRRGPRIRIAGARLRFRGHRRAAPRCRMPPKIMAEVGRRAGRALPAEDADRRHQHARVRSALRALRVHLPQCASASTVNCARSPSRPSRSRTSWPRASRSSAGMDIAEKRVPQDGRMKLKFGAKAIDFRVQHAAHAVRREDRHPSSWILLRPGWASRPWATRRSRRAAACIGHPPA